MSKEIEMITMVEENANILKAVDILKRKSNIDLEPLLSELSEYMDDKADVKDHGEDVYPNKEMILGEQIDHLLYSLRKALGMKTEF